MQVLADAGVEVVGENRAQDLEAKHARFGALFRWHFIGHLQSRKATTVNDLCELCHSLASESAAKRLTIPALVEVNLSGEPTKSGIAPGGAAGASSSSTRRRARADDDAARQRRPRRPRGPTSGACASCAEAHGLAELSMGTSQDYRVAAEEGATYVRVGSVLFGQ